MEDHITTIESMNSSGDNLILDGNVESPDLLMGTPEKVQASSGEMADFNLELRIEG